MLKLAHYTCAFAFTALSLAAQSVPATQSIQTTGMIGLAEGQTARLNLLNPGVPAPALGVVCTAGVAFLDDQGNVLKSKTATVLPGTSAPLDLDSHADLNLATDERREIRAVIKIPPVLPPAGSTISTCKLIHTLEIFDNISHRTQAILAPAVTISVSVPATTTP